MTANEHPILFSGPMVQAILDGRKTQTRRVIKPQPPHWTWNDYSFDDRCINVAMVDDRDGYYVISPYGKPGDRLWVRETWCPVDDREFGGEKWIDYRATPRYESSHPAGWENAPDDEGALKWKPSIFMPRWASRITLEIVSVRVELLQSITPEDVRAEGIKESGEGYWLGPLAGVPDYPWGHAHEAYAALWNSINADRGYGWDSNPWVWVIEFKQYNKEQS